MTDMPPRPPSGILTPEERAAMAAKTERAIRSGVSAIREAAKKNGGTGHFGRACAKATRVLEVPQDPEPPALPGKPGP